MFRIRSFVIAAMAASFLVYIPTASAAPGDPITGTAATQCANDASPSTSKACPGGWIGSILQGSNSHYREDEVVPQRLLMNIPSGGDSHTLTISYLARKGATHAYDSLATWNHTQDQATPCQGLAASICSGPPQTFQMASDSTSVQPVGAGISANTNQHELPAAARQWKMYGAATITATSAVTHSEPTNTSKDDEASVTLTITGSSAGGQALLMYGGHLAVSGTSGVTRAWGPGMGASFVSGGSYHIGLSAIDGKKSTAQNNIQAGAVQALDPAAFTIEKTADSATELPGEDVEYTVTVSNTGQQPGTTSFVDDFDDSLNPGAVTSDPAGANCVETTTGNELLTCQTGSIAPGGSQTFTYTAAMPETFDGESGTDGCDPGSYPIINTATLTGDAGDDSVTVCVPTEPAFTIEKTADSATEQPGEDVGYTVTVTNNGSTSGSTTFVDAFDANVDAGEVTSDPEGAVCAEILDTLSCETGTIAPGGSQTFTYTAAMPETFDGESGTDGCDPGSFPVTNTASLAGEGADDDSVTVCVAAAADFTIEKSADSATELPGEDVEYSVTVTNNGSTSGSTTFVDDFDDNVDPGEVVSDPEGGSCEETTDEGNEILDCETGPIAPGESQTFTYTAAMPDTFGGESGTCATGSFPVTNTATLAGDAGEDSVTVCVEAAAAFTIEKTADPETATAGQEVEYSITVTNTGSTSGSTTFVDVVDDGVERGEVASNPTGGSCAEILNTLTCDTSPIAPDDSQIFTYTATMPDAFEGESGTGGCDAGSFPVTNTASLAGEGADDDSVTVCVAAAPEFTIEKTADNVTATPGQDVEYTVIVTNTGSASGSTSFVDDFDNDVDPSDVTSNPEGSTCDEADGTLTCDTSSIDPDETQTFTYTAAMPDTFEGESGTGGCEPGYFPVTNTASLAGEGADDDSVTVCVAAAPDFTIEKVANSDTSAAGESVEYTVTVTNNGSTAGSTTFVDAFDANVDAGEVTSDPEGATCAEILDTVSCDTDSIAPGESQTFTYTAAMPDTFQGESGAGDCETGFYPVTNTASLAGEGADEDSVTVCVAAAPDFTIDKAVVSESADPGDDVEYTVTVTNNGSTSGSTTFVDDFDDSLDPGEVASDPEGGSCEETTDEGNEILDCETGPIAPGESQTFTYTAAMPDTFEGESGGDGCGTGSFPVTNTAALAGEGADDDSVTICVAAAPDFTIEKTADDGDGAVAGGDVEYSVTVTNNGSTAGSTSFVDDFDEGVNPGEVSTDPAGGSCVESDGSLSCDTDSIAPGESQTFTYTATMPGTFDGESGAGDCETGFYPVTNTASLAGEGADDDSATVCVAAGPEFTIEKSVVDDTAVPGEDVEYTITVTNNGSTSGSTSFVDDYDDVLDPEQPTSDGDGSCTAGDDPENETFDCETGTIPVDDVETFTYIAAMPETFDGESGGGVCETGFYPIDNTATLNGGDDDSVTVCVEAAPEFTIEKSVVDDTADPGDDVEYTITVTNNGTTSGSTSFDDDYDDVLDPDLPTSDGDGSCTAGDDPENESFACETGTISAGDTETFTYTATMPETFEGESGGDCEPGSYPIANTATLEGGGDDVVTMCVAAAPEFDIEKTVVSESAGPGDDVEYTITVTNNGTAPGATTFTDDYDDSLDPELPTSDGDGTCTAGDDPENETFACETGTIPAGGTETFTYTATMPETFEGESGGGDCETGSYPVTNTAALAGEGAGEDSVTLCVAAAPDITVEKSVNNTSAAPGDVVEYTITVSNDGNASGSTAFEDDYDDSLDPELPTSDGDGTCTAGDDPENETFACQSGTIPAGEQETFTYEATLPATFDGESGGPGCEPGEYPIVNTVSIEGGDDGAATVCVTASPDLTVTKSADVDGPATPGQTVTYTIQVSNGGSAPGSTSFVDDFDDVLDPSTPEEGSEGGTCTVTTGNETFECQSGTIPAGGVETFTYTATMPETFSGTPGDGCEPGEFPVANTVTIEGGEPQTVTVCVTAAPELSLDKSVETDFDSLGNEFLVYTLEYTNDGPAEAPSALINDEIPTGTVFEACSNECETAGGNPVTSATWAVGPIAADGGTGEVTLTVRVTTKEACEVTNVATIQFGLAPPVSSNTVVTPVSPLADPSGAHANGSAKGAQVLTSGLLNLPAKLEQPISTAATSQSGLGGPQLDDESVLSIKVPGNGSILRADALRTTSASVVTPSPAEARQTSTAEVAKVCIVPIAGKCTVEANTVRAVASTIANGGTASTSSAGSTIQNLKVVGLDTPVDLNQTTKIPLNKAIFGANSYVAINERSGPNGQPQAGLNGGTYSADITVTMIHVKITGVLGLQAAEVIVSQATAHSDFPETHGCGTTHNNTVSGHAFVAGLFTGPLLADLLLGYTQISPLGGSETEHIADVKVPGNGAVVSAKVADSSSQGAVNLSNATSSTFAEVAGDGATPACVLRAGPECVLSATAVRSASQSTANAGGASSTASGTTLLGFKIGGIPGYTAGTPPPNHTIPLPGIGFIILNERFCDGGTTTSSGCSGATHSGLTVRGLRVVVTVANNLLGLQPGVELIIAEAHSDATFN